MIEKRAGEFDLSFTLDTLRLGQLICLSKSLLNDDEKLDQLQNIYAKFDYPEDMENCSIYANNNIPLLDAMNKIIDELKIKLL